MMLSFSAGRFQLVGVRMKYHTIIHTIFSLPFKIIIDNNNADETSSVNGAVYFTVWVINQK